MTYPTKMKSSDYHEGYWERGEGSNYVNYGDDPGWNRTLDALHGWVKPTQSLLELGCAKGYFVRAARSRGIDAWGIDISEHAVSKIRPGGDLYIDLASATDIPYLRREFDVVCSWEFLEHVPEDELARVLDECERVAYLGALFIHRIGISDAPASKDGAAPGDQHDVTHVNERSADYWRDVFASRGYERMQRIEQDLDAKFIDRDWFGRFFAYQFNS